MSFSGTNWIAQLDVEEKRSLRPIGLENFLGERSISKKIGL